VGRGLADGVYAVMQWATKGSGDEGRRGRRDSGDFVRCRIDSPEVADEPGPNLEFCRSERARYERGERHKTVLGSPGISAGAFMRSPYATDGEADVQLTLHPWDKYTRTWRRSHGGIVSMEIANNKPYSRGYVALRSAHFADAPIFVGPYLRDINDSLPLRWAVGKVRSIAATPPLSDIITEARSGSRRLRRC